MTATRLRVGVGPKVVSAALCSALSGCSFVSVQRPAAFAEDPRVPDPCTGSVAAPVADTVLAGAALIGAYVALVVSMVDSTDRCTSQTGGSCSSSVDPVPALALAGAGAMFGSSAISGFVGTHQCRRRVQLSGRCANGDLRACRRVTPGWTPSPTLFAPRNVPPPPSAPPAPYPPPSAEGVQGQPWIDVPPPPAWPPPDAQRPPQEPR